ncbi:origin recognition complex subunit 5 [Cimex lectularius]|uniref:Origin recognition complex subunit 5 n=1 Tax=Cimex lectularius TaxID=79782 RepID=A0A8I6SDZ4_CIMLE|nr:origin recognition complex subunit 5 [Cimex lectularius]
MDKFKCRKRQINQLIELYGYQNEYVPNLTFVYGPSAVGKTTLLTEFFKVKASRYAYINCIEFYTQRLLLETILSQLLGTSEGVSCDSLMDLVLQLQIAQSQGYFNVGPQVIILDGVEHLETVCEQYFAFFSALQELSAIYTLSVVFVSSILPEKFNTDLAFVQIDFPQYTKDEILVILKQWKPKDCTEQFYEGYLNSSLSVFLRTTRDLNEMKNLVLSNFNKYQEPVIKGEINENDVTSLWRHIAPYLKDALSTAYLGIYSHGQDSGKEVELITNKTLTTFDLPYYAKYLLIAAYLASYNSPKHDKRLFVKDHGKQKKRVAKRTAKVKIASELLGPRRFSLDRLLAIFYSIMEEKASLTVNLMSQIATLVELKILSKMGDGCIDKPMFKCLVGFQCVDQVSKTLGFQVKKYIMD